MDRGFLQKILFLTLLTACLVPAVSTVHALLAGILFSLLLGNPWPGQTAAWSRRLLQMSVVGLGFGLSFTQVWEVGKSSFLYTVIGIMLILLAGQVFGRLFRTERNTSILIAFGTAICGGSAIAAMAPIIKARDDQAALALATVFSLNAIGLLVFPFFGHLLNLDQHQFGLWAALAIHDTSSVVGATAAYGPAALATGTTVKLTRALWIIPFVLAAAGATRCRARARVPLFIIGFVLAAALHSLLPQFANVWAGLTLLARQALVVTLFLIGTGLTREILRRVGIRPLAQGVSLWVLASSVTLAAILGGLIG